MPRELQKVRRSRIKDRQLRKTRYFGVPSSTKGIRRPSTIIPKALADDRGGIRDIKRSPSSFDISGITGTDDPAGLRAVCARIGIMGRAWHHYGLMFLSLMSTNL